VNIVLLGINTTLRGMMKIRRRKRKCPLLRNSKLVSTNKDKSEYMSQMDYTLERLRNDIVNRHQSLNDKLFRLKFEAKRSKKAVDDEKRQYENYIRDLTNKPFQVE
jgi:hypothetical protein